MGEKNTFSFIYWAWKQTQMTEGVITLEKHGFTSVYQI